MSASSFSVSSASRSSTLVEFSAKRSVSAASLSEIFIIASLVLALERLVRRFVADVPLVALLRPLHEQLLQPIEAALAVLSVAGRHASTVSHQQLLHDLALDIGQAELPPLKLPGQLRVVEA